MVDVLLMHAVSFHIALFLHSRYKVGTAAAMQEGSICLEGINVKELQQASLRSAVAVVPQDTVLFADTILRNIRYGRPSATFQDIERAAGHIPNLMWEMTAPPNDSVQTLNCHQIAV